MEILQILDQPERRFLLLSDFDGTITVRDFYQCALEYLDDPVVYRYWDEYQAGERTMFEALRAIFASLPGDEETVWEVARRTDIDPETARAVARLHDHGWAVGVVSHGCRWYISRLLEAQGANLPIIANPGQVSPDRGLEMELAAASPYVSRETGIDKAAVVADAQQHFEIVAYAGNSKSDYPAASRVPPEHRFARSDLAKLLSDKNMAYQPFDDWSKITDVLLSAAS